MTQIRQRMARLADLDAIVALGMQALEKSQTPGLVVRRDKLERTARDCIRRQYLMAGPRTFAQVSFRADTNQVVAAVLADAVDSLFFEGGEVIVLQMYTVYPSAGLPLLRRLMRWARNDEWVRSVTFAPNTFDDGTAVVIARLGAKAPALTLTWVREPHGQVDRKSA